MEIKHPIVIVGAGPGGLMAALHLAKAGLNSLVIEKATFPRSKACGDVLTSNVLREIFSFDPSWLKDLLHQDWAMELEATSFGGSNKMGFTMPFNSPSNRALGLPSCLSARRTDFDNWLYQKAKANAKIQIWENCQVKAAKKEGTEYVLESENGIIRAQYLLIATGANSPLAKTFVKGQEILPKHSAVGLRMYFKDALPHAQKSLSEYYLFDRQYMPGGLYITPFADGSHNVNAVMRLDTFQRQRPKLQTLMSEFLNQQPELKLRFSNAEIEGNPAGCTLFFGTKRRNISNENCLLIGDAAGLTDATNANGIGHAMISGAIAAGFVAEALHANKEIMGYDQAVFARLRNGLKSGKLMQALFSNSISTGVSVAIMNAAMSRVNSRAVEEYVYSKNTTATLLNPAFYWRLFRSH